MNRRAIAIGDFLVRSHHLWDSQWLLLAVGDFSKGDYNAMAVGWGSFGTMWSKPFAQVVVRPTRHTFEFMNRHAGFTLSAFPEEHRNDVWLLGTSSGRDGDKIARTSLTPVPSSRVAAPSFAEAELVVECVKMYWQDMDPACFLVPEIEEKYPERDYHRIYYGEIVAVFGTDRFRSPEPPAKE
ncbi:MAG: flavin reductase [Candidatus Eisenbacteria bacterium]|nr:flavin reductase [Candidatus Eisenbacteria bacterium]